MVQSADGTPPRVEAGVEEVLRGVDRGPTAMVTRQAPGVVAPALPFIVANDRIGSQADSDSCRQLRPLSGVKQTSISGDLMSACSRGC